MLQVRARGNWRCAKGSHFGAVLWPWPWLVKGTDWTASINASQSVTPQFSSLLAAEALQPEKRKKKSQHGPTTTHAAGIEPCALPIGLAMKILL